MSIESATLSDFVGKTTEDTAAARRRERKAVILQEGGVYGSGSVQVDKRAPEQVCLCCGSSLMPHIARVLGDNNGNVGACSKCWVGPDGREYDEDARAARQHRAGNGARHPNFRGDD